MISEKKTESQKRNTLEQLSQSQLEAVQGGRGNNLPKTNATLKKHKDNHI